MGEGLMSYADFDMNGKVIHVFFYASDTFFGFFWWFWIWCLMDLDMFFLIYGFGKRWSMAMVLISFLDMCLGMIEIVFPLPEAVPTLESDVLLKSHQYQTNKVNCMKVPKN